MTISWLNDFCEAEEGRREREKEENYYILENYKHFQNIQNCQKG